MKKKISIIAAAIFLLFAGCASLFQRGDDKPAPFDRYEFITTIPPGQLEDCSRLRGRAFNKCYSGHMDRFGKITGSEAIKQSGDCERDGGVVKCRTTFARYYACEKNGKPDWCETDPKLRFDYQYGYESDPWIVRKTKNILSVIGGLGIAGGIVYIIFIL